MDKNKEQVVNMINSCDILLRFPTNNNMSLMYPFSQIIKAILLSEERYCEELGKNIAGFFEYEINEGNSIFNILDKVTIIKRLDDIDSFKMWKNLVDLFNKKWEFVERNNRYKEIEQWIMNDIEKFSKK
nr:MAG TPA: hypothetical protein [Caudoviricetes sp.]